MTNKSSGGRGRVLRARHEAALAVAQVERALGPVSEERPAVGADEERRRHHRAEHGAVPAAPGRLHGIESAAAVELLRALAEAEHGAVRAKTDGPVRSACKGQLLHELAIAAAHHDGERLRRHRQVELPDAHLPDAGDLSQAQSLLGSEGYEDCGRCRRSRGLSAIERQRFDPQRALAHLADHEFGVEFHGGGRGFLFEQRPSVVAPAQGLYREKRSAALRGVVKVTA